MTTGWINPYMFKTIAPTPAGLYPPSGCFTSASPHTVGGITYTISTSSYTGLNPAWQCVDYKTSTSWCSGAHYVTPYTGMPSTTLRPGGQVITGDWIQLQMSTGIRPNYYELTGLDSGRTSILAKHNPRLFVLLGSNDGSNWDFLDAAPYGGILWIWNTNMLEIPLASLATNYTYFRLIVGSIWGSTDGVAAIVEFKLRAV